MSSHFASPDRLSVNASHSGTVIGPLAITGTPTLSEL